MANKNSAKNSEKKEARSNIGQFILNGLKIGLILFVIFQIGKISHEYLFPPLPQESISLSAYFEKVTDTTSVLKILGEVQSGGIDLVEGKVKITVRKIQEVSIRAF